MKRLLGLTALVFLLALLTTPPASGGSRVRVTVLMRGDRPPAAAKRLVRPDDTVLAGPGRIAQYTAVRLEVTPERAEELAADPEVLRVFPWTPPRLHDERSSQIVAGALTPVGQLTVPGYLAWLDAHDIDPADMPAVDVVDSGLDRGSATDVPPELQDAGGASRVVYARDFTADQNAHDLSGHGTLNASIVAGYSTAGTDSGGFAYGLGVAPAARVGASRIFDDKGDFALPAFYSTVSAAAWRDGARVSSNSWGSPSNAYTPDSVEYDAIVRDADPDTPGNQEMTVVFSAGNTGPGGHVETPGTAKNAITVGAAEGVRPGTDGCGVDSAAADSAFDVAFFSSGGPLDDGRVKPDILAPGTHITGTRSRADGFTGDGVCAAGFPGDATRFTWSSGTSHAAPAVSGAAALLYGYLESARGAEPSPALVKAWLLNTTRYLAGSGGGDDLPSPRQGWGLLDLERALDDAPRVAVDRTAPFTAEGQTRDVVCAPADPTRPVRVTLVWTDPPGSLGGAPEVNDLDLEVESGGQTYLGNNFRGDVSAAGGARDPRNNVEGVWLPAGGGPLRVRVRATSLTGDGVPGNAGGVDQDYALVVYNAVERPAPLLRVVSAAVDGVAPGATGAVRLTLANDGTAAAPAGSVSVSGGPGVTVLDGPESFPAIPPGGTVALPRGFRVSAAASVACGEPLGLQATGGGLDAPVEAYAGSLEEAVLFEDDVEGAPHWTFRSENRGATWFVATDRAHSGSRSWHVPAIEISNDGYILSDPISIPADAVSATFEFYHAYDFERGFDGGIVEASDGGPWLDLGPAVADGVYPANVLGSNPLGVRGAWTGRVGEFARVAVDLTPFAGRTIRLRLHAGGDAHTGGGGWYADDFRVTALRATCAGGGVRPSVEQVSYKNGKLKIKGAGLASGATVAINGHTVSAPASYRADRGLLKIKADAAALPLRRAGYLNTLVVTVDGRASRAFAFAL